MEASSNSTPISCINVQTIPYSNLTLNAQLPFSGHCQLNPSKILERALDSGSGSRVGSPLERANAKEKRWRACNYPFQRLPLNLPGSKAAVCWHLLKRVSSPQIYTNAFTVMSITCNQRWSPLSNLETLIIVELATILFQFWL